MVPDAKLQSAIQRLETGQFSRADTQLIARAYQSGQVSLGAGSVSAGGNIANSIIVTGDKNIVIGGSGGRAIQQIVKKLLLNQFISIFCGWLVLSAISSAVAVFISSNSAVFLNYFLNFFIAYTWLGLVGIVYEIIFKDKARPSNFDYSFIIWVIYPIKIIAEIEIKILFFIFKTTIFSDFKASTFLERSIEYFDLFQFYQKKINRKLEKPRGSFDLAFLDRIDTRKIIELLQIHKLIKDIYDNGYSKRFNPRIYKELDIEVNERKWIETISRLVLSGKATEQLDLTCPSCDEVINSYLKYQDIPLEENIICIHCGHEFKVSEEHIVPMYSFVDSFDPKQDLSELEKYSGSLARQD